MALCMLRDWFRSIASPPITECMYEMEICGRDLALTTHPHLAPRFKKEYMSTPLWTFVACPR